MSCLKVRTIVVNTPPANGYPDLKMVAKRYTHRNSLDTPITGESSMISLIFMHGLGQHKEQWEPIIEAVWASTGSTYSIQEAWALEWQSHGDSAILNDNHLRGSDSRIIDVSVWGLGLATFLNEGHLHGKQVIGVGFSIGNTGLLNGLRHFPATCPPMIGMIIIEPVLFDRETAGPDTPESILASNMLTKSINSQSNSWPDRKTAREYLSRRAPWVSWDPIILDIFVEDGLKAVIQANGTISYATKCAKRQEASAFLNYGDTWNALSQLDKLSQVIPVHVVFGSKDRAMPRTWRACVIDESKGRKIASLSRISASHMVPQEKPLELATLLSKLFTNIISANADKSSHGVQLCRL